jgi:hypothetical protein
LIPCYKENKNRRENKLGQNFTTAKKSLTWFLGLISLDFDNLSEKDLLVFWMEVKEKVGSLYVPDELLVQWARMRSMGKQIQILLKKTLEQIRYPVRFSKILNKPLRKITPRDLPLNRASKKREIVLTLQPMIEVWRDGDKVSTFFPKLEEKLLFDFVDALNYFPLNLIQRCKRKDCGRLFLKATKKEKQFCSRKCSWILASRERYRLQPEVEKEKRREYYHEKVKASHHGTGPTDEDIPNETSSKDMQQSNLDRGTEIPRLDRKIRSKEKNST